jgi:hypothetical protein
VLVDYLQYFRWDIIDNYYDKETGILTLYLLTLEPRDETLISGGNNTENKKIRK